MLTEAASGVYVIAVTPFHDDGRVDEASTDRMTEFYREAGVTGITILGMMGEAPKLDAAEALDFASARDPASGRRCRSSSAFRLRASPRCGRLRTARMEAGAAGVMIAPPPYAPHRRSDRRLLRSGRRGDRARRALRDPGLPARDRRAMTPASSAASCRDIPPA